MLKKLRIENFKGWKDTGEINLAPLTLFFGTNSSGKSSIGQFLVMLKQTVESLDRRSPLVIDTKNAAVNLGSYFDIVHNRDKNNSLKFRYEWGLEKNIELQEKDGGKTNQIDSMSFESQLRLTLTEPNTLYIKRMSYDTIVEKPDGIGEPLNLFELYKHDKEPKDYYLKLNKKYFKEYKQLSPIGETTKYYMMPSLFINSLKEFELLMDIFHANENLFQKIYYLGPLRMSAERTYPWSGATPDSVGYNGENTISAILAAKDRKLNFGKGKKRYSFQEIIAKKLKQMGLIDEFKLEQVAGAEHEYKLKIKTKGSKSFVDLPDVGFGVSQVLPVITQLFYAPTNSIIIMEQPEIHLHPSAQSILADVMIDALNSTENGKKRKIQLIVESHSEHFLRRLQRRIAESSGGENEFNKSSVQAYFCGYDDGEAEMTALEVDEYGSILNWPDNFFGDEMEDIVAHSKAAIKKRKQDLM